MRCGCRRWRSASCCTRRCADLPRHGRMRRPGRARGGARAAAADRDLRALGSDRDRVPHSRGIRRADRAEQPHRIADTQRHDHEIIEPADKGQKVGDRIDRAEGIGCDSCGDGLGSYRRARIARSDPQHLGIAQNGAQPVGTSASFPSGAKGCPAANGVSATSSNDAAASSLSAPPSMGARLPAPKIRIGIASGSISRPVSADVPFSPVVSCHQHPERRKPRRAEQQAKFQFHQHRPVEIEQCAGRKRRQHQRQGEAEPMRDRLAVTTASSLIPRTAS